MLKLVLPKLLLLLAAGVQLGLSEQDDGGSSTHDARRQTRGDGLMTDGGNWPYIVIGGGLAGLAAAQQLTVTYGAQNVLLLEARNRIGGRVKTVKIGSTNATIDVGASWIHGIETSPLYPIAQRLRLDMVVTDYDSVSTYKNGVKLSAPTLTQIDSEWAKVETRLEALQDSTNTDQPLSQALQTAYSQASPTTPVRVVLGFASVYNNCTQTNIATRTTTPTSTALQQPARSPGLSADGHTRGRVCGAPNQALALVVQQRREPGPY